MPNSIKRLRKENSLNCSGELAHENSIPLLKEEEYIIRDIKLDGDAPKQFIKAYFFERDSIVRKSSTASWRRYIAKTAEKWYPHESITEFMINRIGQVLDLHMNEIKLVRANGQIRFLSQYFLGTTDKLIHGSEICGEYLDDMPLAEEIANNKTTSRELFTFEFIKDAVRSVFPGCFEEIIADLVKMITFDALVGNNDRHFYNWGVIDTTKKTTKLPTFAPVYDSARGLLWNYSDENLKHLLKLHKEGSKRLLKYITDASPRISIETNTTANHFELIDFIKRYNKDYQNTVNELASTTNEDKVLQLLKEEFYPFFISERAALITEVIKTRFRTIRDL